MYPSHFFGLFPPFPRDDKVFVAMSFDPRFDPRWKEVICPAVRRIQRNTVSLEPFRVDARKVSDSILTEILDGVSKSRIVIADITAIGKLNGNSIRNGNVMYEVGIAHSVRLPEEVLLFRSDDDALLFDTSNIRVNRYDPEASPDKARDIVANAMLEAFKEIDLRRNIAVRQAAEMLNATSLMVLVEGLAQSGVKHPPMKTMGEALGNRNRMNAIDRLLEMGALRAKYLQATPELLDGPMAGLMQYECTEFGRAIIGQTKVRMGFHSPELQEALKRTRDQPGADSRSEAKVDK
jgi:hypothetical protein